MKFVFDLDGTICFGGKPVSETILSSLENLTEQGHEVIFASARPIRDLLPVLHERFHHYPMIGGNGALVAKNGEIQSSICFSEKTLATLLPLLSTKQISYLIDGDWNYAYTGPATHPILNNLDTQHRAENVALDQLPSIVKILLLDHVEEIQEQLNSLDVVVHKHANEKTLDISPRGIDKWHGLQQLKVSEGEYIAFGNDVNDIAMFQHARHAIMVGENQELAPFASERLSLGEMETLLEDKLTELG
ncbi:HAD-IIB family hydrolase [Oceanobacillus kapialis]|uniref:HAD-IIB family hydrolase n=1 Tax=Oceanobacillus kapialis TaxID=481353 RepID=A0ABW5PZ51_9BACI